MSKLKAYKSIQKHTEAYRSTMQKFNQEAEYLKTLFPTLDKIEGIIVKLDTEGGFNNYQNKIGDPMEENTLILGDEDNNVLLFFKCSSKSHKKSIFEGVTVLDQFRYSSKSIIHRKRSPVDVPLHLGKYIFDFVPIECSMGNLTIEKPRHTFLENYTKGGMMPLKEMKRHPEWKEEYKKCIEIKKVQICKSCGKKSLKGCCPSYNASNRSVLTMVIGWSRK